MSNSSPAGTLTRSRQSISLCLASRRGGTCTRIAYHDGHCCDEVDRIAWNNRGTVVPCIRAGYDHSAEKGLVAR